MKTYLIPKIADPQASEYASENFLKLTLSDDAAESGQIPQTGMSFDTQLGAFTALG